jgi:small subunit ribosomal protein S3Ae
MSAKKQTTKIKKKKWVQIIAPKTFKDIVIGESPVYENEEMIGRTIKVNVMTLTKDPKKQNLNLVFRVTSLDGNRAVSDIEGYEMLPSSIKRLIKRRKEKIDDSFVCLSKDGKKIRIKSLMITNGKANNSIVTMIRKNFRFQTAKILEKITFEDFMNQLLYSKLITKIKDDIKVIYPLKSIEIKMIYVETKNVPTIKVSDYAEAVKRKNTKKKEQPIEDGEKQPEETPEEPKEA